MFDSQRGGAACAAPDRGTAGCSSLSFARGICVTSVGGRFTLMFSSSGMPDASKAVSSGTQCHK